MSCSSRCMMPGATLFMAVRWETSDWMRDESVYAQDEDVMKPSNNIFRRLFNLFLDSVTLYPGQYDGHERFYFVDLGIIHLQKHKCMHSVSINTRCTPYHTIRYKTSYHISSSCVFLVVFKVLRPAISLFKPRLIHGDGRRIRKGRRCQSQQAR